MGHSRPSLHLAGAPLLDDFLAKREDKQHGQRQQTYREHVVEVYQAWNVLKEIHAPVIARVAAHSGVTAERLAQSSLLCVALHDLGKLTVNFQRMMTARDDQLGAARRRNYRHEIVVLWFVRQLAGALSQVYGLLPGDGWLETLAVAGHHKYLADGYLFDEAKFQNAIEWSSGGPIPPLLAGFELAAAMFADQGWKIPPVKFKGEQLRQLRRELSESHLPYQFLLECSNQISRLCLGNSDVLRRFRELFTLLKGLLMTADWMASGNLEADGPTNPLSDTVRVSTASVHTYLTEKIEADRKSRPSLPPFDDFRPFQRNCRDAKGHVIAVAPTGSGKTEAALLWGLQRVESGSAKKIFFLMPTMVTANTLHQRIEQFFQKHDHQVGLVHSTADLIREDGLGENEDAWADMRSEVLREKHFFPPVTVGTVDQLLVTLFHAGRWAIKTLAAANAAVVIDEVHAYDPHTAGLIYLTVKQLKPLGTQFMVMSATLPSGLRRILLEALDDAAAAPVTEIEEPSLLNSSRNVWKVCDQPLSEWLSSMDANGCAVPSENIRTLLGRHNDRGEPLRVLIVVNTVQRCQVLAELLREFDPVCYHSKFIFDDRRHKESLIVSCRPRLLIATQVVEVSLDIDYDVLLTECAPMDALVQRAGRVNRPRRDEPGDVIVFSHECGSERVYGEPHGILQATWRLLHNCDGNRLTERDLIQLVEDAYGNLALAEHEEFRWIQARVLGHQERLYGVLDSPCPEEENALKTRLERYLQVSVIPEQFAEVVYRVKPQDRRRYELRMPAWYVKEFPFRGLNPDGLPICRMKYDVYLGGQFESRESDPVLTGHQIT